MKGDNATCRGHIQIDSINKNSQGNISIGGNKLNIDTDKVVFKNKICFNSLDASGRSCITFSDLEKIRSLR